MAGRVIARRAAGGLAARMGSSLAALVLGFAGLSVPALSTPAGTPAPVSPAVLDLPTLDRVLADRDGDTVPDLKGRLVRVRGIVTVPTGVLRTRSFQAEIQDATGGIGLFNGTQQAQVHVGDVLEAVGKIAQFKGAVQLRDVQVRVIGRADVPDPVAVPVAQADGWRYMGRRVVVEGRASELTLDSFGMLRLTADDGSVVALFIPAPITGRFDWEAYPRGSRIRAAGVVSIYKPTWPYNGGFQITVVSPDDLRVIAPPAREWPSWLGWVVASGGLVLLLALAGLHLAQRRHRRRDQEMRTLTALSAAFAMPDVGEAQLAQQAAEVLVAYRIAATVAVWTGGDRSPMQRRALAAVSDSDRAAADHLCPIRVDDPDWAPDARHFAVAGMPLAAAHRLECAAGSVGLLVATAAARTRVARHAHTLSAAAKLLALAVENRRNQERARVEQNELMLLAITDELTRLYNRRFLDEYLRVQLPLAARRGGGLAFLTADIDHFKQVNDRLGHAVGDAVIAGVADRLRAASRASDLPVRMGGEEFLLVLAECDGAGAVGFAERLRESIAATPIRIDGLAEPVGVTVSIGIALYGMHGDTAQALLHASDQALYTSKRLGRNRVTLAPHPAQPVRASSSSA